ncbi:MAG: hypothetical protein J0L64_10365 [Acidobacteria bacterium]|nr:hypothetical protein [Acidobacteriota bacterium]
MWFGLLAVLFIALSSLCLLTAFASALSRPARESKNLAVDASAGQEYIARYTASIRASAIIMVALSAVLTLLMIAYAGGPLPVALGGGGFIFLVLYSIHVFGTSVRFTANGFVAQAPFQSELRENYESVRLITSRPGILRIEFADGRVLKIRAGLGDPDVVMSILNTRCPENPRALQGHTVRD